MFDQKYFRQYKNFSYINTPYNHGISISCISGLRIQYLQIQIFAVFGYFPGMIFLVISK